MDMSTIAAAMNGLKMAKEIGTAAVELRDFNAMAAKISEMNNLLLKAQESLFDHQSSLFEVQQSLHEAKVEVQGLKTKLEEKGNYQLYELSSGVFVYRSIDTQQAGVPGHFICQPCFDGGRKGVLMRNSSQFGVSHSCPLCSKSYKEADYMASNTGHSNPYA